VELERPVIYSFIKITPTLFELWHESIKIRFVYLSQKLFRFSLQLLFEKCFAPICVYRVMLEMHAEEHASFHESNQFLTKTGCEHRY
jgi:hypothetical protein